MCREPRGGVTDAPEPLRDVIARHGLQASKALGQNFILDRQLLARIAAIPGEIAGDTIYEVGPGPGGLTRALLERGARVVAVERDRRFLPALHRLYSAVFFFPKPVVAAVNGHAIAGGCVLECCADRRIAARDGGRIGVTELLVGVPFPPLAFEVMKFATPPRYLADCMYSGATFTPEVALAHGLVDDLADASALLDRGKEQDQRRQRARRANRAPEREPPGRRGIDAQRAQGRRRHFRERDVHRVARRMRLMVRDVEVAHAERKVDRVEIFECAREQREVEREEQEQRRDAGCAHPPTQDAAEAPRSDCPAGTRGDRPSRIDSRRRATLCPARPQSPGRRHAAARRVRIRASRARRGA